MCPAKLTLEEKIKRLLSEEFSVTRLNRFKLCPALFAYTYLDKMPLPQSKLWGYGRSVHKHLADMTKRFFPTERPGDYQLPDFSDIASFVEALNDPEIDYEKEVRQFVKVAENLSDKIEVMPEKTIVFDIADVKMKAIIDCVYTTQDGSVVVLDYKTSFTTLTDEELAEDFQLSVYAYAVKKAIYPSVADLKLKVGHWNWKYGYYRLVDWKDWGVEAEIKSIIEKIKKESNFPCTANQFYCNVHSCPMFTKCNPAIISEEYGYCRDLRDHWQSKMSTKKPELFEHFNMLGTDKIEMKDYKYSIAYESVRQINKDVLVAKLLAKFKNGDITADEYLACFDFNIGELKKAGFSFPKKNGELPEGTEEIPVTEVHTRPKLFARKK